MMASNPSAFPSPGVVLPGYNETFYQQGAYEGMTLRDYFAAHASDADIANILPDVEMVEKHFTDGQVRVVYPQDARQIARYIHADYMLAAREETE